MAAVDCTRVAGDNQGMRIFWLAAIFSLSATASAHEKQEHPPQKEEAGEVGEEVAVSEAEPPALDFSTLYARLHPSLVHFPLGWLLLALIFDVATFALRREHFARAGHVTLIVAAVAFLPAVTSGLVYLSMENEPEEIAAIVRHRNVILAAFGALLAALALRLAKRSALAGPSRWAYLGLMVAAVLLASVGGHLGGELVHGEDYLPW